MRCNVKYFTILSKIFSFAAIILLFALQCAIISEQKLFRVCGEMDITTVYGTVILGSSPGRRTKKSRNKICGFLISLKRDENPESIGLPKIRKYFWEKEQTSERGGFANSKSPRTKIATPSPGRRTKKSRNKICGFLLVQNFAGNV